MGGRRWAAGGRRWAAGGGISSPQPLHSRHLSRRTSTPVPCTPPPLYTPQRAVPEGGGAGGGGGGRRGGELSNAPKIAL